MEKIRRGWWGQKKRKRLKNAWKFFIAEEPYIVSWPGYIMIADNCGLEVGIGIVALFKESLTETEQGKHLL